MSGRWLPPELPHLARLLDPVTVGELVNTRPLPAQDLVECRLTHIRYRPYQNCTLTWEGRTAAGIVRWFSILACRDGQSSQEYLTATTTSPLVASVGHDARSIFPGLTPFSACSQVNGDLTACTGSPGRHA